MTDQLHRTHAARRQREGELASAMPFGTRVEEETCQLASRLQTILRSGAQAVGGRAAALYLLDDAASDLKLRAQWGLADGRFFAPPRPLTHATADVEALAGRAVAFADADNVPHWNVPERFPSAICVPIAAPNIALGTMWVFSSKRHRFTSRETKLLEIIAECVAAELDREALARENERLRRDGLSSVVAGSAVHPRCSRMVPLIDGWQIASGEEDEGLYSDELYEWYVHDDGALSLTLARAYGDGPPGALTIAAIGGALRANRDRQDDPGQLVERINESLWTGSAGDQWSSLFHGTIQPVTGIVDFATAGAVDVAMLRPDGLEPIVGDAIALGIEPTTVYRPVRRRLHPGGALVAAAPRAVRQPHAQIGRRPIVAKRTHILARCARRSAQHIARVWREESQQASGAENQPAAVLVARRTR